MGNVKLQNSKAKNEIGGLEFRLLAWNSFLLAAESRRKMAQQPPDGRRTDVGGCVSQLQTDTTNTAAAPAKY